MKCVKCGENNKDGASFCSKCGSKLEAKKEDKKEKVEGFLSIRKKQKTSLLI